MRHIPYGLLSGMALLAGVICTTPASAEQTIRCRSDNYAYQHCPTSQHGRVRLLEQFSKSACIEGQTWGYDRRGVWVNHGCEAEFRITPRRRRRRVQSQQTIRCRSESYQYAHCPADTRSGVRLVKQRSKTACIENQTWGSDQRGIWVDQGCDAEFQVAARRRRGRERDSRGERDGYTTPPPVSRAGTLQCRSDNYDYRHCRADTRSGVQLVRQLSQARCVQGETWGYDQRGVWVNRGCEAEFQLGNPLGRVLDDALDNLLFPQQ